MNSAYPKISIITPSYNQAEFLERTILSVLNQDYQNIEYIIIDGGSTDGSLDIIQKYEDRLAYWVSESDRGQSHALNKGFLAATGEIFAWINSDDIYTEGAISNVIQFFIDHPEASVVYGDGDTIDRNDKFLYHHKSGDFDLNRLFKINFIFQPATFFKRQVIEEISPIEESLNYVMDYNLWLKAALASNVCYMPSTLAQFRYHSESKTISEADHFFSEELIILDNILVNNNLMKSTVDVVCSHILQLILHWQKKGDPTGIETLQCIIDREIYSEGDFKKFHLFFNEQMISQKSSINISNNLLTLYTMFFARHLHINTNGQAKKYALSWINQQMIQLANDLFEEGQKAQSTELAWILLRNNPLILREFSYIKLIILKYLKVKYIFIILSRFKKLITLKSESIKLSTFN